MTNSAYASFALVASRDVRLGSWNETALAVERDQDGEGVEDIRSRSGGNRHAVHITRKNESTLSSYSQLKLTGAVFLTPIMLVVCCHTGYTWA